MEYQEQKNSKYNVTLFVATEMGLFVALFSFEFLALEVPRSIFKKGAISNNFFYSLPSLSCIFNPAID